MAHTSAKRWLRTTNQPGVEERISTFCSQFIDVVNSAEEAYQQFQELYQFVGSTDQALADLLFQDTNGNPDPITDTATAEQVAKAADANAAMIALHEIYQASSGEAAITQSDRLSDLRRMV